MKNTSIQIMLVVAALCSSQCRLVAQQNVPTPKTVLTVASFQASADEHPENIAFSFDGTIYVTLHQSAKIWKRTASGRTQFITLPVGVPTESATRANGIVIDKAHNALVLVRSDRSDYAGIWKISAKGTSTKVVNLPAKAGLNGLAADETGNLYATDDANGLIYRIRSGQSSAELWLDDPLLDPQGSSAYGFPVYGVNGIKVYRGRVYVSNPSRSALYAIPIGPDGSAGTVAEAYPGRTFANVDDFAFDTRGNLYVTTVTNNTVDRINPDGSMTHLLTQADGLDQPTSVAFGRGRTGRASLFITNASFYSPPGTTAHASLQRLFVGIDGAVLPQTRP